MKTYDEIRKELEGVKPACCICGKSTVKLTTIGTHDYCDEHLAKPQPVTKDWRNGGLHLTSGRR